MKKIDKIIYFIKNGSIVHSQNIDDYFISDSQIPKNIFNSIGFDEIKYLD
jgi:hypothetical protein